MKVSAIPGNVNLGSITKKLCYANSLSLGLLSHKTGLWGHSNMCTAKDSDAQSFFLHWNKTCLTAQLLLVLLFFVWLCSVVCCVCTDERRALGNLFYLLSQDLSLRPWIFSARLAARESQPFSWIQPLQPWGYRHMEYLTQPVMWVQVF